ncbi:MAG: hypothetical protein IJ560_02590 [Alphaproteobacteria bacterium]|nr:hypothetical protein [Alphaproteobacteria bacterium]
MTVAMHGVAYSADNGCSDEDNEYINPELGLCSVHAYNVGRDKNGGADERAIVQNVIALKSTIITQQMKQQYDYMDAMLKRFRIQLEKAVLQAKATANGATPSGSSVTASGDRFVSSDRNIFIAGVQNCNNELTQIKVYECLNNNINTLYNSSNNGANVTPELRKQLAQDYRLATGKKSDETGDKCVNEKTMIKKADFQECLDSLRSEIRKKYDEELQKQRKKE